MKYKCLVLDHDDTVVNSTASIHYPSFVEYLKEYRPSIADNYTLDDYFRKNFHPGILDLLSVECGLSDAELKEEEEYWARYVENHIPTAYEGMREIIEKFTSLGGIVAVNSHSFTRYIVRDYEANSLPAPHIIFGWDIPKEDRKPSPNTLFQLMEKFSLAREDILVVDDLKPGYDMARSAGVAFAAAGWAHDVEEIRAFMMQNCDYYLSSVDDLSKLLFSE